MYVTKTKGMLYQQVEKVIAIEVDGVFRVGNGRGTIDIEAPCSTFQRFSLSHSSLTPRPFPFSTFTRLNSMAGTIPRFVAFMHVIS